MKEKKRCSREVPTKNPNWMVHITWTDAGKAIRLRGSLVDRNFGYVIDSSFGATKTVRRAEDVENGIKDLARAVYEKNVKSMGKKEEKTGKEQEPTDVERAFESLRTSDHQIQNWDAATTQRTNLIYFKNHFLPVLKDCRYPEDFMSQERMELKDKLFREAMENKNSCGNKEIAMNNVRSRFWQAQLIYNSMRLFDPMLPVLTIDDGTNARTGFQREQIKSLPYPVTMEFRKRVKELIRDDPRMARGAALMYSGGLRSGEASAVTGHRIEVHDGYIAVWVLQQEFNGQISKRTKTRYSYRRVILDEWGGRVVTACTKLIGDENEKKEAPLIDKDLSAFVKKTLEDSGCTAEMVGTEVDVAAHILRRNRAGIWRNICGFSQDEIDYLLGHKGRKEKIRKFDPKSEETLNRWALMVSRYDIDDAYSTSPVKRPLSLKKNKAGTIAQFSEIRMLNDTQEPVVLILNAEASEMGESIAVDMPYSASSTVNPGSVSAYNKRKNVEIIGNVKQGGKNTDE